MKVRLRRRVAIAVLALTAVVPMGVSLQPAVAGPFAPGANVYYFDYNVDASTHMKKLDQTITVPGGRFKGGIDFGSGLLVGNITLPQSTVTFKVANLVPALDITVKIIPVGPVTGLVDFNTMTVSAKSSFNIKIVKVRVTGTTIGVIQGDCITKTPVTVAMTGPLSIGGTQIFSGGFTMPPFRDCGTGKTVVLNQVMAGPDNTFTATASERES